MQLVRGSGQQPLHGLPAAQSAALLDCHPDTVRRWISRFIDEGKVGWPIGPSAGGPGGADATSQCAPCTGESGW